MTPAIAIPVFLVSIGVMLAASSAFAQRLDHIGLQLGMPEALLGLLTALAANAPNISSAIAAIAQHQHALAVGVIVGSNTFNIAAMLGLSALVAARVRARHESLELEAFVGLWLILATLAVVAGRLDGAVGIGLIAVVAIPYVVLLAAGPRLAGRLPLGLTELRFLRRSFGEPHAAARTVDRRREIRRLILLLAAAICLIVAGSVAAVRASTDLAHAWSVSEALAGVTVLAILTSLPNAWTGVRFGLQHRGSALMSETINSNSINILAGIALPAALGSLDTFSGLAIFDVLWLLVMTAVALVLFGRRSGAGRSAGTALIALYAVFVAVQFARA